MIIQQSTVAMASRHELFIQDSRTQTMRFWRNPDNGDQRIAPQAPSPPTQNDRVTLSPQAKQKAGKSGAVDGEPQPGSKDFLMLELVKRLVETLTGKRLDMQSIKKFMQQMQEAENQPVEGKTPQNGPQEANPTTTNGDQPPPSQGWGLIMDSIQSHYEKEVTNFAAQGQVVTGDGKQVDFTVEFSLSREYQQTAESHLRAGDAVRATDPLMINFSNSVTRLTQNKFTFDLDNNGVKDQISFTGANAGLLSFDKNNNGKIDDGSELFGPTTGNGFQELAKLDQDGNGWIDEKDAAYSRLSVWTKDSQGKDLLASLKAADVGAIHLDYVATDFSHKDATNQLLGQLRSSGVYLKESGGAGSIQQVDLAV